MTNTSQSAGIKKFRVYDASYGFKKNRITFCKMDGENGFRYEPKPGYRIMAVAYVGSECDHITIYICKVMR